MQMFDYWLTWPEVEPRPEPASTQPASTSKVARREAVRLLNEHPDVQVVFYKTVGGRQVYRVFRKDLTQEDKDEQ